MTLGRKMAFGFGSLVVIASVVGVVSWRGLSQIDAKRSLLEEGSKVLDNMNACALLRRDFGATGFDKGAGESKDASEKWADAYATLMSGLKRLEGDSNLDSEERDLVRKATAQAEVYKTNFEKLAAGRKARDQAAKDWRTVGGKITVDIAAALKDIIEPAIQKARDDKKFEDMENWSNVALGLDREFVQPFLLLRVCGTNLIMTRADQEWATVQDQLTVVKTGLAKWSGAAKGHGECETLAKNLMSYVQEYDSAAQSFHSGVLTERAATQSLAEAAKSVVALTNDLGKRFSQEMQNVTTQTKAIAAVMGIACVVVGVLLALFITRSIVTAIKRIIAGLTEGSEQVNAAAGQVASASQQLAEGASEQASSLEETSSALEEMAAMTRTNAENAKKANQLAGQARVAADDGDKTMGKLSEAMTAINASSEKISKIIKVIEEISFQTNLLALNAAVEAARAGEHGKGFAVVADEVRNLAQRAAQAAKETTTLIEGAVNNAREGTQVAGDVAKALGAIVGDATKVSELIDGISKASDEQAQGVEQVNTAVSQMDKVTQQNASGAEESAAAAEELAAQAQAVKCMVDELITLVGASRAASVTAKAVAKAPAAAGKASASRPVIKQKAVAATASKSSEEFLPIDSTDDLNSF